MSIQDAVLRLPSLQRQGRQGGRKVIERVLTHPEDPEFSVTLRIKELRLFDMGIWRQMGDRLSQKYCPILDEYGELMMDKTTKQPIRSGLPVLLGSEAFYVAESHCHMAAQVIFAWEGEDRPSELDIFALLYDNYLFAQVSQLLDDAHTMDEGGDVPPLSPVLSIEDGVTQDSSTGS
jgi:hypothetical protein